MMALSQLMTGQNDTPFGLNMKADAAHPEYQGHNTQFASIEELSKARLIGWRP